MSWHGESMSETPTRPKEAILRDALDLRCNGRQTLPTSSNTHLCTRTLPWSLAYQCSNHSANPRTCQCRATFLPFAHLDRQTPPCLLAISIPCRLFTNSDSLLGLISLPAITTIAPDQSLCAHPSFQTLIPSLSVTGTTSTRT